MTTDRTGFSPNHRSSFLRDDGTEVDVAMRIDCEGHPLPWYVVDHVATLPDTGAIVELTDEEIDRLNEEVEDDPPRK